MDEENKMQDAETQEVKEPSMYDMAEEKSEVAEEEIEEPKKKRKLDFYVELALFLILGVLIGVAVKTEAVKRITIGFNDYQMKILKQEYNINQLQADAIKEQTESVQEEAQPVPEEGNENIAPDNIDNSNDGQNSQNQ